MTATQYKICASDTPSILASEVNALLTRGWGLYGGPFVNPPEDDQDAAPIICQAMIKVPPLLAAPSKPKLKPKLWPWTWELACIALYLALTCTQLFVRPITGLADNGDFPKALFGLNICDPTGQLDAQKYVVPVYTIGGTCYWDSGLHSSETLFVRILKWSSEAIGFSSIRTTGAGVLHLSVVLAALVLLLSALRPAPPLLRFGIPPLAILIFSDVAYTAYLNSFYFDAASLVFLLLTAAAAAAALLRPRVWAIAAFGLAGALLALSKTQHVVTGFLFAGLAVSLAIRLTVARTGGPRLARAWAISGAAIFLAAFSTFELTPEGYRVEPLYSLVFYSLLPSAPTPAVAIAELGLPASDLRFSGTHAYSPGAAVEKLEWRRRFLHEFTYGKLVLYYLRHPSAALRLARNALARYAPAIRPGYLANYRREDGFPPTTLARRFDAWSNLRAWLLFRFPSHIVLFYTVMGIGSLLCIWRTAWAARWPLYPLALVVAMSGAVEFLFAVLLDATETDRHLFFFHVLTELLILCAVAAGLALPKASDRS